MPEFETTFQAYFWYTILAVAGIILLFLGYKFGRFMGSASQRKRVEEKESELFQAQRGFKNVYDQELATLREENEMFKEEIDLLKTRVEEYRRKAAGYGGLFGGGGKRADAMYALLLENEALEEALFAQNDKLRQERTESVKEQLRAASYRRVLMSQLLEEGKMRGTADKLLGDDTAPADRRLPGNEHPGRAAREHEQRERQATRDAAEGEIEGDHR